MKKEKEALINNYYSEIRELLNTYLDGTSSYADDTINVILFEITVKTREEHLVEIINKLKQYHTKITNVKSDDFVLETEVVG